MVSAAPVLEARGLVRRYGARTVLDVEQLHVNRGEVVAIVGPNGAGKSTLFRTLLLLERPDAGTVRLDGVALRHRDPRARGRIAGVFQRPVLFSGSVRENVSFGVRSIGIDRARRRERVEAALAWLGLSALAAAPVHELSGGEAQRVALARALVLEPDVLLLDEPTSSLDVTVRRRFRQDLERVARQRAGSVILITHDAPEAFGLADRIAVMQDGRFVQLGTPDDIVLRPGTPFVAELTGAELLLHGVVEELDDGLAAVRLAPGMTVWAAVRTDAALRKDASAVVAYRPEDIVLVTGRAEPDTSAVNRLPCVVDAIVAAGALVRVRLRAGPGLGMTALLTRRSVESLGIAPGSAVTAHLKATALHAWGP
ncbi:MAG TPA: ABC transporter ATP-binding protein [Longimicrobiales bacterium]